MLGELQNALVVYARAALGDEATERALEGAGHPRGAAWAPGCPLADSSFAGCAHATAQHQPAARNAHSILNPQTPGWLLASVWRLPSALLTDFGAFFMQSHCGVAGDQGYARMMRCLGPSLLSLLNGGLNDLHLHLSLENPAFRAPEVRVAHVTATSAELHYRSTRQGLQHMLEGALHATARTFCGTEVRMQRLRGRDDGTCDHEVYLLTFPDSQTPTQPDAQAGPAPSWFSSHADKHATLSARAAASTYTPSPELFYRMFPFHFMLDTDCNLMQVHHPYVEWSFVSLQELSDSCFLLVAKAPHVAGLELKGQFIQTCTATGQQAMLFMGSPRLSSLEDVERFNIYFSDIPPHDMSRDFMLLAEQRLLDKTLLESAKTKLEKETLWLEEEMECAEMENARLRETLLEALAKGTLHKIDMDTPADKALKLIDKILCGAEVTVQEAIQARRAITQGGSDLHRPLNFREQLMKKSGMDDDVNQALIAMLEHGEAEEWHELMKGSEEFSSDESDTFPPLVHTLAPWFSVGRRAGAGAASPAALTNGGVGGGRQPGPSFRMDMLPSLKHLLDANGSIDINLVSASGRTRPEQRGPMKSLDVPRTTSLPISRASLGPSYAWSAAAAPGGGGGPLTLICDLALDTHGHSHGEVSMQCQPLHANHATAGSPPSATW